MAWGVYTGGAGAFIGWNSGAVGISGENEGLGGGIVKEGFDWN